jgi:hypothetical protein
VAAQSTPLYKIDDRSKLTGEKLNNLFNKATKIKTRNFDGVLPLSEEDKLDDLYSICIQVSQLQAHFIKFDMDDIFKIVDPYVDVSTGETKLRNRFDNLFSSYYQLTEEDIARSSKWYNEHMAEDFYRQNLQLTFEFFKNNCTKGLWEKWLEDYDDLNQKRRVDCFCSLS